MTPYSIISIAIIIITLGQFSPLLAQTSEIKLDTAQAKITTVSAMRARRAPQVAAEEIVRLKLGTVVNAIARSTNQDTVGVKTDYWYLVNLPNGQTGWLFGGLLLDYDTNKRVQLVQQIIEERLKAENTDFADRQEIYDLANSSASQAKDANTRAEFELLKLLALANWAVTVPNRDQIDKSPYRDWYRLYGAKVTPNEFAGGHNLRSELFWDLEAKYHNLPIADRIAWAAAENPFPHDCEGDEVCHLFIFEGAIKYLNLHPQGTHVSEALKSLDELLTDDVVRRANDKGGDKYVVEERTHLRQFLSSARTALAKISNEDKAVVLKKLDRVTPGR